MKTGNHQKKQSLRVSRSMIVAICVALILVASVIGTIAYLTDTTETVKNTFTVGKLFDPDDDDPADPTPDDGAFVLYEHEATDPNSTGAYTRGTEEVLTNSYKVLPGVDLPKDPFVRTDDKLELDAYVFVEIVDNTATTLTVTVDPAWTLIDGIEGTHDGKIYTLASGKVTAGTKLDETYILKDNKVVVSNAEITDPGTVDFYGYMIQAAGFANASEAAAGLGFTAP